MSIDWNLRQIMFQPILLKIQGKPFRQVLKSFRKKTRKEKIKRLLEK